MGGVLASGRRSLCVCLRVLRRHAVPDFVRFPRYSTGPLVRPDGQLTVALALLLRPLAPGGPLVFGLDETIEQRSETHIGAKGVFQDAVRSSHNHFDKAMGLRWLSLTWLTDIPWAQRIWALPHSPGAFVPVPRGTGPTPQDAHRRGLPSLQPRLVDLQTAWRPLTVRSYDGCRKVLNCAPDTALRVHSGQLVVPLHWVRLRDPTKIRALTALLSTDP